MCLVGTVSKYFYLLLICNISSGQGLCLYDIHAGFATLKTRITSQFHVLVSYRACIIQFHRTLNPVCFKSWSN